MKSFDLSKFNGNLIKKDGSKIENVKEYMQGKNVFIYFSAHWCPPCRGFTPMLKDFYENHSQSKNFEIIFVSSDRTKEDMQAYFNEMADYLALDFGASDVSKEVKQAFDVSGIPKLVLLNDEGVLININARNDVVNKPDDYPWSQ